MSKKKFTYSLDGIEIPQSKTPMVLVDIDGTFADSSHRLHFISGENKNWPEFFSACVDDRPIKPVIAIVRTLLAQLLNVVFVTGRPERIRAETKQWLKDHATSGAEPVVLMRQDEDHRPDFLVKKDFLGVLRREGLNPV